MCLHAAIPSSSPSRTTAVLSSRETWPTTLRKVWRDAPDQSGGHLSRRSPLAQSAQEEDPDQGESPLAT